MPLSTHLQNVDDAVPAVEAAIVTAQEASLGDAYWQGPYTHLVAPSNGLDTAPDNLDAVCAGQSLSWDQFVTLPATMIYRLRVDQYDGPSGIGWLLVIETDWEGDTWSRISHHGPETGRSRDWFKIPVSP